MRKLEYEPKRRQSSQLSQTPEAMLALAILGIGIFVLLFATDLGRVVEDALVTIVWLLRGQPEV